MCQGLLFTTIGFYLLCIFFPPPFHTLPFKLQCFVGLKLKFKCKAKYGFLQKKKKVLFTECILLLLLVQRCLVLWLTLSSSCIMFSISIHYLEALGAFSFLFLDDNLHNFYSHSTEMSGWNIASTCTQKRFSDWAQNCTGARGRCKWFSLEESQRQKQL